MVVTINPSHIRLDGEALIMRVFVVVVFIFFLVCMGVSRDYIPQNYLTPPYQIRP